MFSMETIASLENPFGWLLKVDWIPFYIIQISWNVWLCQIGRDILQTKNGNAHSQWFIHMDAKDYSTRKWQICFLLVIKG